jgi:hypothetical protein
MKGDDWNIEKKMALLNVHCDKFCSSNPLKAKQTES